MILGMKVTPTELRSVHIDCQRSRAAALAELVREACEEFERNGPATLEDAIHVTADLSDELITRWKKVRVAHPLTQGIRVLRALRERSAK